MGGEGETLYALLSADGWSGVALDRLVVRPDGRLELLSVPALSEPVLSLPGSARPSGLALDRACGLYASDELDRQVTRFALDCPERAVVSAGVAPAGLCVGPHGWLFVADRGGSILVFTTPGLSLRDQWTGALAEPVALACGPDAVYVLDKGQHRALRFDPFGEPDSAANARLASPDGPVDPVAIAADEAGTLYVADGAANAVLRFGPTGAAAGPPLAPSTAGQAIAVAGGRLYVADEPSGEVRIFSVLNGRALDAVAGYTGPVSALAADFSGTVYIKTGADESYLVAESRAGRVDHGTLTTTVALDAGVDEGWSRARVDADVPDGTRVRLETSETSDAKATPAFEPARGPDTMLGGARFLSLHVTLEREPDADATATPVVAEVRASAGGDSYLEYLPAVYARSADDGDLLLRLLALSLAMLGDRELEIEELHRRSDPATAPIDDLPRLASWQAFEVPRALAAPEEAPALRDLIEELPELYARRGTPWGLVRFAEIYAGVRPALFEEFRERRLWMLDGDSPLGLQTGLAATSAGGIVVDRSQIGTSGPEDPEAWGSMLFEQSAHRFTAAVNAAEVDQAQAQALERVLEAEKPAHTQFHLCVTEARLRVGLQASLGLDAIVAGGDEGVALDERGRLDVDARPADEDARSGAVGRRGRVGVDAVLS
jgi:phage tail-like protein